MTTTRHRIGIGIGLASAALALATGCASTQQERAQTTEIAVLRAENAELRERLQLETRTQMVELLVVAYAYADAHGRLPARSSELRGALGAGGWVQVIAPVDRCPELLDTVEASVDPWRWVDEHGSYAWLDGTPFNADSPVLVQRGAALGEPRWVIFGDAHGEQIAYGGAAWRRMGLPLAD